MVCSTTENNLSFQLNPAWLVFFIVHCNSFSCINTCKSFFPFWCMFNYLSCTMLDMTSSSPDVTGQLAIDTDIPRWPLVQGLMYPPHASSPCIFYPQKVAHNLGPGLSPSQHPYQAWIKLHHLRIPTVSGAMVQFFLANCLSQNISQIWRKLCPSVWTGYGLWYAYLWLLFHLKNS